ncbi:hypothetical protein [Pedobacter fastidiosus]|uniref:hypothetical protein n=1 Tax=Pedobacter fastidiosus TaxID=2765361 RepID=UPI00164E34EE|nr:hypothetical protein [Pedobacter fastidiosus]
MPIILNKYTSLEVIESLQIGEYVTNGTGVEGSIIQIEVLKAKSGKLFKISLHSGKIFFIISSIAFPPINYNF